jgi:hypothetical protein
VTQRGRGEEPHPVSESRQICFVKKCPFCSGSIFQNLTPFFLLEIGDWELMTFIMIYFIDKIYHCFSGLAS